MYPGAFYLCALFLSKQVSNRDSEGDNKDTHTITQAQDGAVSPLTIYCIAYYQHYLSMSMEGLGQTPEQPILWELGVLKTESPAQALQQSLHCKERARPCCVSLQLP